jgi:hypothetical protein
MQKMRDQADPGEWVAIVVAMEVVVAMITVVAVGVGMAVMGYRKLMNAIGVVNWSIVPWIASPRPRRNKPM